MPADEPHLSKNNDQPNIADISKSAIKVMRSPKVLN